MHVCANSQSAWWKDRRRVKKSFFLEEGGKKGQRAKRKDNQVECNHVKAESFMFYQYKHKYLWVNQSLPVQLNVLSALSNVSVDLN